MRQLRVTVDVIEQDAEGDLLVNLVTDDGTCFGIPLSLLPEGTQRGDILIVSFERNPDETDRRREHISALQRRLFGHRE